MVVIRKNGQMVVYFDSTNKPKYNNQILSPVQFDDETELDDSKFRKWQKNLVEDSQIRARRNGESIFESDEQRRIRKIMNSEQ